VDRRSIGAIPFGKEGMETMLGGMGTRLDAFSAYGYGEAFSSD
jgi:hypothetical protein